MKLSEKGVVRDRLANGSDGLGLSALSTVDDEVDSVVIPVALMRGVARVGLSTVRVIAGVPAGVVLPDPSLDPAVDELSRSPSRECGKV